MRIIPEGFAHGFQTLSENVEMFYVHSKTFSSVHDGGINPFDEDIGVKWPLKCTEVSKRDINLTFLKDFNGIKI